MALEIKLIAAVDDGAQRQAKTIGAENQVRHAQSMLNGVRKLLATAQGEHAFPDGPDFSRQNTKGGAQ